MGNWRYNPTYRGPLSIYLQQGPTLFGKLPSFGSSWNLNSESSSEK